MAKQYNINDLADHIVHSIDEGKNIIDFIESEMAVKMQEMQLLTGSEWDKVCDEHYKLVQWKKEIQSQLIVCLYIRYCYQN